MLKNVQQLKPANFQHLAWWRHILWRQVKEDDINIYGTDLH